jgi:hypothetical protein
MNNYLLARRASNSIYDDGISKPLTESSAPPLYFENNMVPRIVNQEFFSSQETKGGVEGGMSLDESQVHNGAVEIIHSKFLGNSNTSRRKSFHNSNDQVNARVSPLLSHQSQRRLDDYKK